MADNGYPFSRADFAALLLRKFYPERTDHESAILRAYLGAHLHEFDAVSFSVRVGAEGIPDPTHLPGVQDNARQSVRRRIDMLAFRGPQPVIVEVKRRLQPAALGQILHYRELWSAEHPDQPTPELVAIAETSDDQTIAFLQSNGVSVFLYEGATA